jgi:hypothetical protein
MSEAARGTTRPGLLLYTRNPKARRRGFLIHRGCWDRNHGHATLEKLVSFLSFPRLAADPT